MSVIIVGERSGRIRDAFRILGYDAISCDLYPSDAPGPHIIVDNDLHLKDLLYSGSGKFKMMIAHPTCTALANSGVWYYRDKLEEVRQAAIFFNMIGGAPIDMRCIENPVQHKYARKYIVKQSQTIQPWQFGEDASKRTCLWLIGLPLLQPTDILIKKQYSNQTPSGQNNLSPGPGRAYERSKTYPGIALAMAKQWGPLL